MITKTNTTTNEALAEDIRRVQGIGDDNGGGIVLMTGPIDWQQQQSVDFPCYRVANSNTVSYFSHCCLVLIFFSSDYFFLFTARNTISTEIMRKIILYQVYTNLTYVPPAYRREKNYEFSLSIKTYVSPYNVKTGIIFSSGAGTTLDNTELDPNGKLFYEKL